MKELTEQQSRVFSFIVRHHAERGVPPTVREIGAALGYKSINNVRQHLRLIAQKGHIRLTGKIARGIEIVSRLLPGPAIVTGQAGSALQRTVPLVGLIAAGKPITAHENITDYIALDGNLFKGEGLFTLRVTGDSMKGIGVLDGDIVIVRQQTDCQNNDIVVAIIDGEATLKRFLRQRECVVLHPENPLYNDIVIQADRQVEIVGKMVGMMRKC
ncbi:MAG: transcriptional repressor LexA [Chitinivibrionales bacterium]|nr:transcriptional repressor LexA [Chitinivibrionales bacterium]